MVETNRSILLVVILMLVGEVTSGRLVGENSGDS